MHRDDGFRLRRDTRFDLLDIDVVGLRVHIDEDRAGTNMCDGFRRGDEAVYGGDDLISWADATWTKKNSRQVASTFRKVLMSYGFYQDVVRSSFRSYFAAAAAGSIDITSASV